MEVSFFYINSTTTSLLSCFIPADVPVLKSSLSIIFQTATLSPHGFFLEDFPTHTFTAYVFQFPVHITCPTHLILIYWNILTTLGGSTFWHYLNLSYYVLDQRHFHTSTLIHSFIHSFIHSVVCLTTGPKSVPKRALHIVRSRASSFK